MVELTKKFLAQQKHFGNWKHNLEKVVHLGAVNAKFLCQSKQGLDTLE